MHIPYISGYDGHVQRLVIVNRNRTDVAYTLTMHLEGGPAAGRVAVDGVVSGGRTTTVAMDELPELVGGAPASATLTLVSDPSMVEVASILVNLADESTDTVVHHLGRRDG